MNVFSVDTNAISSLNQLTEEKGPEFEVSEQCFACCPSLDLAIVTLQGEDNYDGKTVEFTVTIRDMMPGQHFCTYANNMRLPSVNW